MKAERRTMAPGTARKPASRKRFSPQPSNFDGTLSHHDALSGPPEIALMSLRRKDSSTAFLSHWLTFHLPLDSRIATRASPLSSNSSASSTASRISPLVAVETPSRASNAELMVDSSEARDIERSLRPFLGCGGRVALSGFGGGESRLSWASGQRAADQIARAMARPMQS